MSNTIDAAAVLHDLLVQAGVSIAQSLIAVPLLFVPDWVPCGGDGIAIVTCRGFGFKPLRLLIDPNFDITQIEIAGTSQILGRAPLSVWYERTEVHWAMTYCPKGSRIRVSVRNIRAVGSRPRITLLGVTDDLDANVDAVTVDEVARAIEAARGTADEERRRSGILTDDEIRAR